MHSMKRMKIRIENDGGYKGLAHAKFPLVLEATVEYSGLAHVRFSKMMEVQEWFWDEIDAREGGRLCFLSS
ncbi:hypothetical protein [Escherichia phage PNJ1809-36]|uniref:Uncharacterized protein n=1 Tax=Escherichia phage PNJ1809-36 TaxID=2761708 RepID=A0A7S9XDH7_9CAUD|nr:hypothetical protein [Escherichia phage PNJ1809-36]